MKKAWSSIVKEEACQITSPFNKKLGCFKKKLKRLLYKNNLFSRIDKSSGKPPVMTSIYLKISIK